MISRSVHACLTAAVLAASMAAAAEPAALRALFPREAEVFVAQPGLARLDLPAEVLAACRADLSDLRLFDGDGREIAFLLDSAPPSGETPEVSRRGDAVVVNVRREEARRETGPPVFREVYEVRLPSAAPPSGAWVLTVAVSRPKFVARVTLEGLAADGRAVELLRGGSLFRLAGTRETERLRLEVPPFDGDRLRLTLESEEGGFLEPVLGFESGRRLSGTGRSAVPLEVVARRSQDGKTVLEAERPRGLVTDLLRVVTTSGTFDRQVSVWDEGPGSGSAVLGVGRVYRVRAVAPVEETEIALGPPRGDRLRVEVEDGDSPPLEGLALEAVVRRPVLVFEAAAAGAAPAAVLRFGGGRAYAPRYDLAGFALAPGRTETGKRALALTQIHDLAVLAVARLGPTRPNPSFDDTPVLAFAMRPGAPLDARSFSHRRTVRLEPSPEGLSRIRLAPADLAVLRGDLADLRIADGEGRQRPYLLERDSAHELVDLKVDGPEQKNRRSVYRLSPPVTPLRIDRVLLDADAPYFDRAATLVARQAGSEPRTVFSGRLARPVGDPRPVWLEFPADVRVDSLELAVEDGDDAPLALRFVRARAPVAELFVAAPAGAYTLLLGSPEASEPRYDLARVRDVVLAVSAARAGTGDLLPNPDYSTGARLRGSKGLQSIALWSALIAAVAVLLVLTLRLARR